MHDERLKIQHENGRSNLDEMWHSMHVQEKRKKEGSWAFCQSCTIWCYFETSFLWPPDKYFFLNLKSKGQWAKEKVKQLVESKTGWNFTRKLPGSDSKIMVEVSANPLNHFRDDENIVATTPVALPTREIGSVSSNLPVESDPNVLNMDEATAVVITASKSNAQIH
jgi:hypothetical protein